MFQTLKNLPRDTRDTLFLLAVVAWVVAPLGRELVLVLARAVGMIGFHKVIAS